MPTENTNPETEVKKEETPEWAKELKETLSDLPNKLKEVLTPAQEQPQEAPPANQPVEIVLPQAPEQEQPQPHEVEQPQEQPPQEEEERPKKKRSFLDWLM